MLCWSNDNGQYTLYNTSECSRSLVWLFVFEIMYAPQWRFQSCRLPGQATRVGRAVSLWVEKNPVPPPNHRLVCCPYYRTALPHRPTRQYSGKQYAR